MQGVLRGSPRGPMIFDEAGLPIWVLELPAGDPPAWEQIVIVEGSRSGFDRIKVDWIGRAHESHG